MKAAVGFSIGTIVGAAAAAIVIVALRSPPETPPTLAQGMAALSEAEVKKLESTAERLFTKGSYPILAAHVRSAELAMRIYDHRSEEELVRRECGKELATFFVAAGRAEADRELVGIWPLIQEKRTEAERFIAARSDLASIVKEWANQMPEPTSGSVTPRAASFAEPSEARDARVAPPPPVAHR